MNLNLYKNSASFFVKQLLDGFHPTVLSYAVPRYAKLCTWVFVLPGSGYIHMRMIGRSMRILRALESKGEKVHTLHKELLVAGGILISLRPQCMPSSTLWRPIKWRIHDPLQLQHEDALFCFFFIYLFNITSAKAFRNSLELLKKKKSLIKLNFLIELHEEILTWAH